MITDRNGQQEIFLKLIIKYNFARKEEYLSNNNLASEFVEKGVLFKPIKIEETVIVIKTSVLMFTVGTFNFGLLSVIAFSNAKLKLDVLIFRWPLNRA